MDLIALFGRFHPVVLHLPIGAVFTIAVIEVWLLIQKQGEAKEQVLLFVLHVFTLLTALAAIATGLILRQEDVYGGSTLDLHQNLGIATGVVIVLATVVAYRAMRPDSIQRNLWVLGRRACLIVSLGLITATGHFGGELTHGKDFLTEHAPAWIRGSETDVVQQANPEVTVDTTVYEVAIQPIIENYCVYCHDQETTKGKLRMDSPEMMLAGGSSGPLFIPGDVEHSLMLQRIRLPLEDEEHMPPAKKRQPAEEEIDALVWWIESGASFDLKLNDPAVPDTIRALVPGNTDDAEAIAVDAELDMAVVQALREKFLTIQRIEQGSDFLWIDFSAIATTADDSIVQQLKPLAGHIVWLNLSRTQITDKSLSVIGHMPHLQKLDLRATAITDSGLTQLEGLEKLQRLNLTGTATSGRSFEVIQKLPSINRLHLFQTEWTPEEVEQLRTQRPELYVNYSE